MKSKEGNLYILLISVHGLIRGHDLELGRDADTGGQTKYVVELARALGEQPDVAKVDLVTRRINDENVSQDYSEHTESLSENVNIIRIDCADQLYIAKEQLWDYLDNFSDNLLEYLHSNDLTPHIIHSHKSLLWRYSSKLSEKLSR